MPHLRLVESDEADDAIYADLEVWLGLLPSLLTVFTPQELFNAFQERVTSLLVPPPGGKKKQ